jgi:hypothetical protein
LHVCESEFRSADPSHGRSDPRGRGRAWLKAIQIVLAASSLAVGVVACGSSSPGVKAPTIAAARVFKLAGFEPRGPVEPGKPTTIAFSIGQPSGKALTSFKTGPGPHTGVHVIIVRDDLSSIIHRHPPIASNGEVREKVVFPTAGRYRVLVDAYPNLPGQLPNFQLKGNVTVRGAYRPKPLPRFTPSEVVDGYRFQIKNVPHLKSVRPAFLNIEVRDAKGRRVTFTPWYGALAHAIFFRAQSLDYFHTHVCGAGAANCTSALGGARITGKSTTPGKLSVGVLIPTAGTWRLFLQCKVGGTVVTVPYTLRVA